MKHQSLYRFENSILTRFAVNYPNEFAKQIENITKNDLHLLTTRLDCKSLIHLLPLLSLDARSKLLEEFSKEDLAKVATLISPVHLNNAIKYLDKSKRKIFMNRLPAIVQSEIEALERYPEISVGSIMDTKFIILGKLSTVEDALKKIKESQNKKISEIYISEDGKLAGSIRLQELIFADSHTILGEIMASMGQSINEMSPKDEVMSLMEQKRFSSLPVTSFDGEMVGVVRYDSLFTVVQEDALASIQSMVGASSDEKSLSGPFFAIKKRLPWLTINLLTAFLASAVVGMFEDMIAKVTALAVLLPIVAGQSGNTGSQALAVTIRGLTLREFKIRNSLKIIRKEIIAGFFNGVIIGTICFISVYFWSKSLGIATVIGASMVIAMVVAGAAGATIPIILHLLKQDPAQSSSIILTTVTDVAGFFTFLGLAVLFSSFLL